MHKHHFPNKKNTKRELKRENKILIFFKEKEKKHKTFKVFHFISLYCSFYYPHIKSRGKKKESWKVLKKSDSTLYALFVVWHRGSYYLDYRNVCIFTHWQWSS